MMLNTYKYILKSSKALNSTNIGLVYIPQHANICFCSNNSKVRRVYSVHGKLFSLAVQNRTQNYYGKQYCSDTSNDIPSCDSHQEYIDYTILPKNLKKEIREKINENKEEIATQQEQTITKKQVSSFLKKINANKKAIMNKMKPLGMDESLFKEAFVEFRNVIWSEFEEDDNLRYVLQNFNSHSLTVEDMFNCFYDYSKQRYPLSEVMDELKSLSDLKNPANWFITARGMKRKIIFHSGPTNSGKTHHALDRFEKSDTGIYGGPLRMLASEVYERTNKNGISCDLLTGEQRLWAKSELEPSSHVSCTVEMCKNARSYDCAVIDEIQLMRDKDRGWGWTRAFLGVSAKEIHICGEPAAEKLVKSLVKSTGDEIEIRNYNRLTKLSVLKKSIGNLKAVRPGDCVVAFSRQKIFQVRDEIERKSGFKCSVIYGGLPPNIRLEQARRFNDPDDEHCILVASDAIGMGINLNIKRLIFNSLRKFDGQNMIDLPSYHAKQIAGRAGRFGTEYPEGFVTSLHEKDLLPLHDLITCPTEDVEKAGMHPTYEQIELFSHVLPKATFAELLETFVKLAKLDNNYFMCDIEHLKQVAKATQHIPLTLRQRHDLCSATTDRTNKSSLVVSMVVKIAHLFSDGEPVDLEKIKYILRWPPRKPRSLEDLEQLESIHDIFDLYLWLSYRYEAIFVDREEIRALQQEIEVLIKNGVDRIPSNDKHNHRKKTNVWTNLVRKHSKKKK